MNENCIRKTKTILNKMFDMTAHGVSAEDCTAEILFHYYEYLRENGYTTRRMYWDVQAAKETIGDWRNLNDTQLPKTYEKNLLLASIFSCDFRDIVFTEYDGEHRPFDFEPAYALTKENDIYGTVSLYLPRIREKVRESGERFVTADEMADECYARVSARRVSPDGLTLLDRATRYIEAHGGRATAPDIVKSVRSVYFNWLNGKAPSSVESLLMFSQVTGLDVNELYRPIYEPHAFEITLPPPRRPALGRLRVSPSVRRAVEAYLESENADAVRCGADYAVTRTRDTGKYGILVFDGTYGYYLGHEYDYVVKDRDVVVTVRRAVIDELPLDDLPMLLQNREENVEVGFSPIVQATALIRAATLLSVLGRYTLRRIPGGLLIVDKMTEKTVAARFVGEGEREIVTYENGRPLYGMLNEGILVPPVYDERVRFSEGLFTVKKDGKYGFLNAFGQPLGDVSFDYASVLKDGRIAVGRGGKFGYADENGDVVVGFTFDEAGDFSEGLAAVCIGDKAGYIDRDGSWVIEPAFDAAFGFSEGVAVVEIGGKYGYIDRAGRTVLPAIYEEATACRDGKVKLLSCGRYINKVIGGAQ